MVFGLMWASIMQASFSRFSGVLCHKLVVRLQPVLSLCEKASEIHEESPSEDEFAIGLARKRSECGVAGSKMRLCSYR